MPRLFTGLQLPADLAMGLSLLRGGLAAARWIEVADYHITLRFIGDVDDRVAVEIDALLARVAHEPFTVTLDGGLIAFGGAKPRAIVATVAPSAPLDDLLAEQERLLRRLGLPAETRKFVPHVTLARLRQTSPRMVADYIATHGYRPPHSFEVHHVALFSARDSVGGGPYVVEAIYPLVSR